ncbi:MAG TPA: diguanylate cyclase [Candidatus Elarobacter sp.]|jgi:diguanylate cyclase (GGDEF)-like protein
MRPIVLTLVLLAALVPGTASAAPRDPSVSGIRDLLAVADAYRDRSGAMTFADVRRKRFLPYRKLSSDLRTSVFFPRALWLRFSGRADGDAYLIAPETVRHGEIDVVRRDGSIGRSVFGTSIPIALRPFGSDENVVPLPPAPHGGVYYVRISPDAGADRQLSVVSETDALTRQRERVGLVVVPSAVALGAILALASASLLLGLVLGELSYMFYGITLIAFALAELVEVGNGARVLLPFVSVPKELVGFVARIVYDALLLVFCWSVGKRCGASRFAQRLALASFGALVVGEALQLIWPSLVVGSGLSAALDPFLTAIFLLSAFVSVLPALRGERNGYFYIVAIGATLVGLTLGRAGATGLLPPSALTADGPVVGIVFQAILLSVAFAERIRLMEGIAKALITERGALEDAAYRDGLTGIPNRRAFDVRLTDEWRRAARTNANLALIVIDVDHFKSFNDTMGHPCGDEVLGEIARCAALSLRGKDDFVARYGGEEFVVVLPNCDAEAAGQIAERLLDEVRALAIPHPASPRGIVTISAGAASASPRRNRRARSLVERADAALYVAKRSGRDRVSVSGAMNINGMPLAEAVST